VDTTDASAPPVSTSQSAPVVVADPLDLGRVRYYFTSGIVLSNNGGFQLQSSGTQAGLFLGLDADRTWLALNDQGFRPWNLNTYFDARLTSVATQQATTTGNDTTTLQSFNQSKKAASLQVGTYLPRIIGVPWKQGKSSYSLFAAPLGKIGFVTLTDDQTPATTTANGTNASGLPMTDRFFKFYSYGVRLGVWQNFNSKSAAPDTIKLRGHYDRAIWRFRSFPRCDAWGPQTIGGRVS
jgi:hypothetical protein